MRRKDREMPAEFAWTIVDKCEWASLALVDPEGDPYVLPISIAREGNNIFFHSAHTGFKIDCLKQHAKVCLACVGDTHRLPYEFSTEYESAIVRGTASEVTDETEMVHALKLICQRHTPTFMDHFDEEMARSRLKVAVWRIEVTDITGKRKKNDAQGKEMKFGRME